MVESRVFLAALGLTVLAATGCTTKDEDYECLVNGKPSVHCTGSVDDDVIKGSDGDNGIFGAAGDDELYAQAGDDYLVGGAGADSAKGGLGDDVFEIRDLCEVQPGETVDGGPGDDILLLGATAQAAGQRGLVIVDVEHVVEVPSSECGDDCACGTLPTDPSAPDDLDGPPARPEMAGGGTITDEGEEGALLAEVAKYVPDSEVFVPAGSVELLSAEQYEARIAARERRRSGLTLSEYFQVAAREDAERDDDLMFLATADGRAFRQRPGVLRQRPRHIVETSLGSAPPPASGSGPVGAGSHAAARGRGLGLGRFNLTSGWALVANIWGGGDGRQLKTSSSWAWRAVGVSLRSPSNLDFSSCSAVMIAPRVALTSAHCVSPDGDSLNARRLLPAARGESWNGDQSPFGERFVEWYVWPDKWEGQDSARYDYALLILRDINWSPGWIFSGTRSGIAYTSHNTAGYPSNNHDCAASPAGSDGRCDGYMYRQYEEIRSAGYGYFFHEFDTEGGQSGSTIYYFNEPSYRKVFGLHEGDLGKYNTATRINSSSFGLICNVLDDFTYTIDGETRNTRSSFFSNATCN